MAECDFSSPLRYLLDRKFSFKSTFIVPTCERCSFWESSTCFSHRVYQNVKHHLIGRRKFFSSNLSCTYFVVEKNSLSVITFLHATWELCSDRRKKIRTAFQYNRKFIRNTDGKNVGVCKCVKFLVDTRIFRTKLKSSISN